MVQGFLNSFFECEQLPLKAPCYTQVSRRASSSVDDAKVAADMLIEKFDGCVETVLGDDAYDKTKTYRAARKVGAL